MDPHDDDLRIFAIGQDARDLLAALMATQPPTVDDLRIVPATSTGDGTATVPASPTAIDAGCYLTIDLPDDLALLTERTPSGHAACWPAITDCHPDIDGTAPRPDPGWTRYKLIITGEKWGDDE